jgi:hypothetical protein
MLVAAVLVVVLGTMQLIVLALEILQAHLRLKVIMVVLVG